MVKKTYFAQTILAATLMWSVSGSAFALSCSTSTSNPTALTTPALECPSMSQNPAVPCDPTTVGPVTTDIINGCDPPLNLRAQQGTAPRKIVMNVGSKCSVDASVGAIKCAVTSGASVPSISLPTGAIPNPALNLTISLPSLFSQIGVANTINTAVNSALGSVTSATASLNAAISSGSSSAISTALGTVNSALSAASASLNSAISASNNSVNSSLSNALNAVNSAINTVNSALKSGSSVSASALNSITAALNTANSIINSTININTGGGSSSGGTFYPSPAACGVAIPLINQPVSIGTNVNPNNSPTAVTVNNTISLPNTAPPVLPTIWIGTPPAPTSTTSPSYTLNTPYTANNCGGSAFALPVGTSTSPQEGTIYLIASPQLSNTLSSAPPTSSSLTFPVQNKVLSLPTYDTLNVDLSQASAVGLPAGGTVMGTLACTVANSQSTNCKISETGSITCSCTTSASGSITSCGSSQATSFTDNIETTFVDPSTPNPSALLISMGDGNVIMTDEPYKNNTNYSSYDTEIDLTSNEQDTIQRIAPQVAIYQHSSDFTGCANKNAKQCIFGQMLGQTVQYTSCTGPDGKPVIGIDGKPVQCIFGRIPVQPPQYTTCKSGTLTANNIFTPGVGALTVHASAISSNPIPPVAATFLPAPPQSYLSIPASTPMVLNLQAGGQTSWPEGGTLIDASGLNHNIPQGGSLTVTNNTVAISDSSGGPVNTITYPQGQQWAQISAVLVPVAAGTSLPVDLTGTAITPSGSPCQPPATNCPQ